MNCCEHSKHKLWWYYFDPVQRSSLILIHLARWGLRRAAGTGDSDNTSSLVVAWLLFLIKMVDSIHMDAQARKGYCANSQKRWQMWDRHSDAIVAIDPNEWKDSIRWLQTRAWFLAITMGHGTASLCLLLFFDATCWGAYDSALFNLLRFRLRRPIHSSFPISIHQGDIVGWYGGFLASHTAKSTMTSYRISYVSSSFFLFKS
jgi:hypothetical protein